MARGFTPCVLTANDLLEGDVIYLAPDGAWTRRLASARLFVDEAEADRSLAAAESQEDTVIGPYLAAAIPGDRRGPQPAHFREAFRAAGPSNCKHGKPTGN